MLTSICIQGALTFSRIWHEVIELKVRLSFVCSTILISVGKMICEGMISPPWPIDSDGHQCLLS